MPYKNISFNPKCNSIEDVLKREEVKGLEFEKVVYVNEYEAVAVFNTPEINGKLSH